MLKHVLITGASRGIGRETAYLFAEKGYSLTLCCRTNIDSLMAFGTSLAARFDTEVRCVQADVSDPAQVKTLVQTAYEQGGPVEILIHNAGISLTGLITDLRDEEWDRILKTNLSSAFYLSRAVLPGMIHRKDGVIVNVSSVFGIYGASCEAAYSATKGGVNALTRSLAKELAPSNIRVNAVAFGAVDTQMNAHLTVEEKEMLSDEIPAGRFCSAREAASFLLQVAESPAYLTGQIIQFDGGWI